MIIKGIIESITDAHVNLVNADLAAKQKSLQISEEKVLITTNSLSEQPVEWIQVEISEVVSRFDGAVLDNERIISMEGKVKLGEPQLTRLGAFCMAVSLEGTSSRPGQPGEVGNILGEDNVNVSFMSVGRRVKRGKAIMAIGVDEELDKGHESFFLHL